MAVLQDQVAIPDDQTPAEVFAGAHTNASQVLLRNTGSVDLLVGPRSSLYPPLNFIAAAVGSGGSFAAGTYFWVITSLNAYGETTGSSEAQAAIVTNGSCDLTWDAVPGASQYNLYRSIVLGNYSSPALVRNLVDVTAYTDTGAAVSTGAVPGTNTAQVPLFFPFKQDETISWTAKSSDVLMAQTASPGTPGEISILMLG